MKSIKLHPGITSASGNISITPLAISLPPMPLLGSTFVTNGQAVSIVNRLPVDLHCGTEEAARSLNCSLDLEACKECFPNHSDGTVECNCRDVDLDAMMEIPETRLPITKAKVWLENNGPTISATYVYAPVQIHLQMKGLAIHLQLRDSKCFIEEARLHGCYRCGVGAQITYKCRSDYANPLATVKCEDGTLFVAHCSTNGTIGKETIPYGYSDVNTLCTVDCPAGLTKFVLNGTLYYIPLRKQWGHQMYRSEQIINEPETLSFWPSLGFDIWVLSKLLQGGPIFLGIISSIGLALIAVYLFMRLSPIFRVYRQIARTITILATLARVQSLTTIKYASIDKPEPFSSNPNQFGWNLLGIVLVSTSIIILTLRFIYLLTPKPFRPFYRQKRQKHPAPILPVIPFIIIALSVWPAGCPFQEKKKFQRLTRPPTFCTSERQNYDITLITAKRKIPINYQYVQSEFHHFYENKFNFNTPTFLNINSTAKSIIINSFKIFNKMFTGGFGTPRRARMIQRQFRTPSQSPPKISQFNTERLDLHLARIYGDNWFHTIETIDKITEYLRKMEIQDTHNCTTIVEWDYITYQPAKSLAPHQRSALTSIASKRGNHWNVKMFPTKAALWVHSLAHGTIPSYLLSPSKLGSGSPPSSIPENSIT
ncbi:unnamed protein product [Meloidogyne enterolobii]|uniref:Uncharacterized protein n=1 Tax=Meloidogyne enterolobii TaxID=390850 RepID=A0ACB1B0Y5_MELEN